MKFFEHFSEQHALRISLLYPLCLMSGTAVYLELDHEPSWRFVIFCSIGVVFVLKVSVLFGKHFINLLLFFALWFLAGVTVIKARTSIVSAPKIEYNIGPVTVEGELVQIENGAKGNRLRIRVGAISNLPKRDTPEFVRVTQKFETNLWPGRSVSCYVFLSPPPKPLIAGDYNFNRQAFFEKLGGVGFVLGRCKPINTSSVEERDLIARIAIRVDAIRRSISVYIHDLLGDVSGGMATAMITGERSFLSLEDQDTLRSVGLAHLLAISGLHMGLAAGVFFALFRFIIPWFEFAALRIPAQKLSALAAIIGSSTYLFLSGASVATQRAYIMAMVALIAILIDRPAFSMRSLAVAMVVVICIQPETVVSPGFQMSFAATAALIALYENWPIQKSNNLVGRFWGWLIAVFGTSVTASIATAPFAAFHFGRIASLSILSNLVVMPIISLWAAPSAAFAMILTPFGWQEPMLHSFGVSLEIVLKISRFFQEHSPDGNLASFQVPTFILLIASGLLIILLKKYYKIIGAFCLILALASVYWQRHPIIYVDKDLIIYAKEGSHWIRILPENMKKSGLVPLKLKDEMLEEPIFLKNNEPVNVSNDDYRIEVTEHKCGVDPEEEAPFFLRVHASKEEICLPISASYIQKGISVTKSRENFYIKYFPSQNRPWN